MKTGTKFWLSVLGLLVNIISYLLFIGWLYHEKLPADVTDHIKDSFRPEYFFILFVPPFSALLLFLNLLFSKWIKPLGKIAEEARVIQTVNPSYRLSPTGSYTVRLIGELINRSADMYEELSVNVREKIETAGKQTEEEKNTLAAFISELSEGVLICRHDGRLLLFNKKAKEFLTDKNNDLSPGFVGLGRSVFTLIDKNMIFHALNEIQRKLNENHEDCMTSFVIVGKNKNQLKVEAVPVLDSHKAMTGFIFIMTDITEEVVSDKKADLMIQDLTKSIRASLGGIRAAVETIIDFPDMDSDQRRMFNEIILNEAKNLGRTIDINQRGFSFHLHSKWPLVHITADELAEAFRIKALEIIGITVDTSETEENLWLKADSYIIIMALVFLSSRIESVIKRKKLLLRAYRQDKFINIDLVWEGAPVRIDTINKWKDLPVLIEGEGIQLTLGEVAGHHDAEILPHNISEPGISAIKIFIPPVETPGLSSLAPAFAAIIPEQRPEFYDFDLFDQQFHSSELDDIYLKDLTYTVFDTETTGLYPMGGDEIISIGAVRIVNGKLLYNDIFEQLIDPKRSLPKSSIKIHGIEPEMLEGQPDIGTILPLFHTFTEETVLVGHNVAFDMAMLKVKEKSTGIIFTAPVLDTLLLSAVVHPEQEGHNIEAITKRLGINVIGRHTAVGDALTTAEMFLKLVSLLEERGIHTLKEAVEASKKTFYARLKY